MPSSAECIGTSDICDSVTGEELESGPPTTLLKDASSSVLRQFFVRLKNLCNAGSDENVLERKLDRYVGKNKCMIVVPVMPLASNRCALTAVLDPETR